jgi:hypothetical protein
MLHERARDAAVAQQVSCELHTEALEFEVERCARERNRGYGSSIGILIGAIARGLQLVVGSRYMQNDA